MAAWRIAVTYLLNISQDHPCVREKADDHSLVFYDTDGRIIDVTKQELIFFIENLSIRKIYPYLFMILKRLLQKGEPRYLFLFLKRIISGRWLLDERFSFRTAMYPGIRTHKAEYASPRGKITIYCSGENVPADIAILKQVLLHNQYNISQENMEDKVVIDAGANVGIFSAYAAKLGARKVYAFEPVKKTFEILKRNIAANGLKGIVVPINKALGKAKGKERISYLYAGDAGASMKLAPVRESQIADVTTIDDFMEGRGRIDFIKMDVEGYEEEVLTGGRRAIGKYKPVLSFAAYHLPDDKTRLPQVVRSIEKSYSCTLMKKDEEVLYCE